MPQLFTVISVSLCSSVKVGNRLRGGRPRDRCSNPGSSSLLYSNPQPPDLIQGRPNILFRGQKGIFRWGEEVQRPTPVIVGYVAGLTWKNRSKWYTQQIKLLCNCYSIYTQLTNLAEGCITDGGSRGLDTHRLQPNGLVFIYAQGNCYFQDYLLKFFCLVGLIKKGGGGIAVKEVIKNFILCILYFFWVYKI